MGEGTLKTESGVLGVKQAESTRNFSLRASVPNEET